MFFAKRTTITCYKITYIGAVFKITNRANKSKPFRGIIDRCNSINGVVSELLEDLEKLSSSEQKKILKAVKILIE